MQKSDSHIKETLAVGASASLVVLFLSWPAFSYYFFAENFLSLRVYGQHNSQIWQAAFSRIDGVFFNPGLFLSQLWWDFVLPANPVVYHIRNFLFLSANLFLLHRLLLRFVNSRTVRITAVALFAVSKIHLTAIGYLNVFGSSLLLSAVLLSLLFCTRYIESRSRLDYWLMVLFSVFCIFSSDAGFVVVVILAALVIALDFTGADWKTKAKYWTLRFSPLFVISLAFLLFAYVVVGPPLPNETYSPRLSLETAVWQAKAFLATVGNLSLTRPESMGQQGLTQVFARNSRMVEMALCVALWLLVGFTVWRARGAWRLMIVPVVWIGVYLTPYLLIRNHQVYYFLIPLAGLVLLVGIALDRAKRQWLTAIWLAVVMLIAINGYISNRRSYYDWEYVANQAEIVIPMVMAERCNPVDSLVFVTSPERLDFWVFTLGGPMVPHLIGYPRMQTRFVDSETKVLPNERTYHLPEQYLK